MSQTKTLAELTIKNNFLFSAVMLDPENCRGLLEIILGIPIDLSLIHIFSDTYCVRYGEIQSVNEIIFDEKSQYSFKEVLLPVSQTLFYFTEDVYKRQIYDICSLRNCKKFFRRTSFAASTRDSVRVSIEDWASPRISAGESAAARKFFSCFPSAA